MGFVANTRGRFMHAVIGVTACAAFLTVCETACAQNYPDRPVRIIVAYAPGGPTDVIARILAQYLSDSLGKQFVIENQAGAGGNIGMGNAARATPDGYTIMVAPSSYVVQPSLFARQSYDPYKDFIPVTNVGVTPNILAINPEIPAKTVAELVTYTKANPGKVSFGSSGVGTTAHLSGELFKLMFGLDMVHVPFGGAGPALQSTVAGHTPVVIVAMPPAAALVQSGKIRGLAVTSKQRSAALPDVPTMAEADVKDLESDTFQGVFVPAGTPKPIVDILYKELIKIVARPDVRAKFGDMGFEAVGSTQEEFAAQIRAEIPKWGKVIKDAGIKVE